MSDPNQNAADGNRLRFEKSPYLLQHADNPVQWHAWNEASFTEARQQDKPIFLSVGYSTCHWCHVMAHECFEDEEVAARLNEVFVCIKVDREERPDIDQIYMTACQAMTGAGGWPLSIFLAPDLSPFFAATYVPKHSAHGRMGLLDLIDEIEKAWQTRREDVDAAATQTLALLNRLSSQQPSAAPPPLAEAAYQSFASSYDKRYGGFGQAPKFPTPHILLFLLAYSRAQGDPQAAEMVRDTLQHMHRGGIYDQVGLGMHRYSTDEFWLVPHFEKMLYDQALVAIASIEGYAATGDVALRRMSEEILHYTLRELRTPAHVFHAAEDADSAGGEGNFYLWQLDEIRQALPAADADLLIDLWGIQEEGNFQEEATGAQTGANILHCPAPLQEVATRHALSLQALLDKLQMLRDKLYSLRAVRPHPHRDDKILTDWNSLLITALAMAARVLQQPSYAEAAARTLAGLRTLLYDTASGWRHRYRDGEAAIAGMLDDYATLLWAHVELYRATYEPQYLLDAHTLAQTIFSKFSTSTGDVLCMTQEGANDIPLRPVEVFDNAAPSGNAIACHALLRLATLLGDEALFSQAQTLTDALRSRATQHPTAMAMTLCSELFLHGPRARVVIVGAHEAAAPFLEMLAELQQPDLLILRKEADEWASLPTDTQSMTAAPEEATAYYCGDGHCAPPCHTPADLRSLLRALPCRR